MTKDIETFQDVKFLDVPEFSTFLDHMTRVMQKNKFPLQFLGNKPILIQPQKKIKKKKFTFKKNIFFSKLCF